jgi:hypothetical protein
MEMAPQIKAMMPGMPCKLKMPQVSINPKDFSCPSDYSQE